MKQRLAISKITTVSIDRANSMASTKVLKMCLDFSQLSYETCKQYRTDPYPTFSVKRNITIPETAPNATDPNRLQSSSVLLQNHSSLSSGAYAGIGITVGAFTVCLLAVGAFVYRRKKARRSGQSGIDAIHEVPDSDVRELAAFKEYKEPQELHASEWDASRHPVELDATQLNELDATKR
jgi:hypothetical protein